jgi:putative transposase
MLVGRRYRLVLTPEQQAYAQRIGDVCRVVWNTGLEQRQAYRRRGGFVSYVEQARQLAEAKKEHPWLAEAPSHTLQQTLMDLDKACKRHGALKVRWRSSRRWSPSFRLPDPKQIRVQRLGRKTGRVKLPKLGWVRLRWSRPLGGTIRSATVSREGACWHISFLVEDGATTPEQHRFANTAVGVDRGVKVAVAASDGNLHDRPFISKGEQERCRRLQQKLARCAKRSGNRSKTIAALGRVKAAERRRRQDFCAQLAHTLVRDNALVVLEDLKIGNMSASARGSIDTPGRNVKAKAGLNRQILAKGWYAFELALAGAARKTGTKIVKVNAAYTSQRCHACGYVAAESRESQAVFCCTACGHTAHADVNAAQNILAAGLAVTACGDLAVGRSVKQEPAGNREGLPLPPAQQVLVGIPRL